jgi:hypothetical protein
VFRSRPRVTAAMSPSRGCSAPVPEHERPRGSGRSTAARVRRHERLAAAFLARADRPVLSPGEPVKEEPVSLDHLVYAVPDLLTGVAVFAKETGVDPVPGGSHPGGTANYLVGLGPGSYLEIIGPDPDQPGARPRAFGLENLTEPRLTAWAVRTRDLGAAVREARAWGYDPGEIQPLSRRTPDGALLRWRLTHRDDPAAVRTVPFLIDWGGTPHPSAAAELPRLGLESFTAIHPDPGNLRRDLAAVGGRAQVAAGPEPALRAVLSTPNGPVILD